MTHLAPYLPLAILVLSLLVLAILIFLVVLVLRARKRAAAAVEPQPEEAPPEPEAGAEGEASPTAFQLHQSFRRGVARLSGFLSLRADRYRVPWIALVGQTGSRPVDLLADAGLNFPLGRPHPDELQSQVGCCWWFFDRGLVLDLAGEYVLKADGASADERGWRTFLRLLQRYRPRRPLDAFVVTVACSDLAGADRGSPDRLAALEQAATGLYGKLWDAQKALGLRCPVYLLITGCEALAGFEEFSTQLAESVRQGIFGWSSPYEVDRGYQSRWLDEAYDCLRARVLQAQVRIFGAERPLQDEDGAFVFPGELETLRGPLRVFLNQLFKTSVYHQPMFFRGLYFCGETGPERQGLFLKDLFERKVFPEAGLAAPTPATLVARNRRARLAQVLVAAGAVVLALGTWLGYRDLRHRKEALAPYLVQTAQDLVGLRSGTGSAAQIQEHELEDRSFRLFESLTRLDARRYRSAFLPSSWFTDFDDDLVQSFVLAYDRIIFTSLAIRLEDRATAILGGADDFEPAASADAGDSDHASVRDRPAFARLREFVADLGILERHARSYNSIAESRSLDDLAGLVEYLFGKPLPADFFRNAGLYRDALSEVRHRKFDFAKFAPEANRRAHELTSDLYEELFHRNPRVATLEDLSRGLSELGRRAWFEPETFRRIVGLIRSAESALSQPDFQWVFRDRFDLGGEYRELLARLAASPFLTAAADGGTVEGTAGIADLQRHGEQEWIELRQRLAALDSPYTGPLLEQRGGRPQMQLSADVLLLEAALADLGDQAFMLAEPPHRLVQPVPAGAQVQWDGDLLAQAADLYEPYHRFTQRGLSLFPPELRSAVELVARQRVGDQMLDLVEQAKTVVPSPEEAGRMAEDRLASDVADYRRDGEVFRRLLEVFSELRLREDHDRLADLFAEEGVRLLRAVDALLDRQGLYLPRRGDVEWWRGEGNLALLSFDVADEAELKAFLEAQRTRIQALAHEYAQPLLAVLVDLGATRQRGARTLVARWDGILTDLSDYQDKKPANPLSALESLVATELPRVDLDRCLAAARRGAADTTHFFASREAGLRDAVARRCRSLAEQRAVASYRKIAHFFNQRLAGRFPFAAGGEVGLGPEADVAAVREFFRLFDAAAGDVVALGGGGGVEPAASPAATAAPAPAAPDVPPPAASGGEGGPCRFAAVPAQVLGRGPQLFLCELQRVRDFLAPYLDASEPVEAPAFDVEVEFRVNRRHERLGDQIIDWTVDVGDRRIDYPDPQPSGRWTLGVPIEVTLRWASGSPWVPVAERERPEVEVRDRTAVYSYRNLWSLVSLVNDHRSSSADLDGPDDLRPHTLRFRIPTRRQPVEADGAETADEVDEDGGEPGPVEANEGEARVFIRLSLVAPESKQPLVVPTFPSEAPRLAEPPPARAR